MVVFPLMEEIKKTSDEFVSTKGNLAALETKIKNSIALEETYLSHEQEFEKIDALFIDSRVPIDFVNFLKEAADSSQLSIKISSAFFREAKDGQESFLSFYISLIGSSLDITKFLAKLENAPFPIEIQNLKIAKSAENNIDSDFSIKVFSKGKN